MKLNLGCQVHYFEGFVNIDIVGDDPNIKVDLNCDVSKLPYEENSVDFIYAGHLVEHFYPDTLPEVIKEWYRVLKPGGKLVIVTPDCGAVMRDYAAGRISINATWQQIYGRIYSYDTPSERHHIAFDKERLVWLLGLVALKADYPWKEGTDFDFANPPTELLPFMDSHISRGAYQLGIVLTK